MCSGPRTPPAHYTCRIRPSVIPCGPDRAAPLATLDPSLPHQARHSLARAANPLLPELGMGSEQGGWEARRREDRPAILPPGRHLASGVDRLRPGRVRYWFARRPLSHRTRTITTAPDTTPNASAAARPMSHSERTSPSRTNTAVQDTPMPIAIPAAPTTFRYVLAKRLIPT